MSHDRGCPRGRERYEYADCPESNCYKNPKKQFDTLVFIGRFQPFHNGHKAVIDAALEQAKQVIVILGSAHEARNIRNPFTWQERKQIIEAAYSNRELRKIKFVPVADYPYDDNKWIAAIQSAVEQYTSVSDKIGLIGHSKDHTSFYLKIFPTWGHVEVPNVDGIDATTIRERFFESRLSPEYIKSVMDEYSHGVLVDIILLNGHIGGFWDTLQEEYKMIKQYKESWKAAPYLPTFVTVDAVVVQSGHVLLVRRGAMPGKGLWALPGGFLDQNETMVNGCIRELREETRIKVPAPVLKGSIKDSKIFDNPNRSTRGRTITQAFFIELENDLKLPKVKGSDDADKAKWVPFADIDSEEMFEDHFHIIDYFTNIG